MFKDIITKEHIFLDKRTKGQNMKKYSREEIESGVWKIMCKYSWETTDEMHLDRIPRDAFGLDSIDFVEIVVDFEKEFGISIPDNEVDAMAGWNVREMCDYVEERLKERKKRSADV